MAQQVQFYKRKTTVWVPKPLAAFNAALPMLVIVGHTDQILGSEPALILASPDDKCGQVIFMTPEELEANFTPLFGSKYTEEHKKSHHPPDYTVTRATHSP